MKDNSIMIVDDDETDRYLIKRLVKKAKITSEIFEAENGRVALDFFFNEKQGLKRYPDSYPPSIVFLDINMPIMGGFEFLEKFKALKNKRNDLTSVVFAMFTSSDSEEDVRKAKSYDFVQEFITKGSLSVSGLKEIVRSKSPNIKFEGE